MTLSRVKERTDRTSRLDCLHRSLAQDNTLIELGISGGGGSGGGEDTSLVPGTFHSDSRSVHNGQGHRRVLRRWSIMHSPIGR